MTSEAERADACRKRAAALKRLAETFDNTRMRDEILRLAQEWETSASRAERRARRTSGASANIGFQEFRDSVTDARAKARH